MRGLVLLFSFFFAFINSELTPLSDLHPSRPSETPIVPVFSPIGRAPRFLRLPPRPGTRSYGRVPRSDLLELLQRSEQQGFLATSVCEYFHSNESLFVVNLEPRQGTQTVVTSMSLEELKKRMETMTARRAKPVHICVAPGDSFSAVWHESRDFLAHFLIQEGSIGEVFEADLVHGQENYFPDALQVYRRGRKESVQALAIWRKGFGNRYRIQQGVHLEKLREEMRDSPLTLHAASAFEDGNETRVFLVWKGDAFSWDKKTIPASRQGSSISLVDEQIQQIMRANSVPAVSVSVYKKGRELYSAAFGYADLRRRLQVERDSVFRVASISKVVTAMCVCRLVSEGRLSLQSPVFGASGLLAADFPSLPFLSPLRFVTVDHLLTHSAGAWSHLDKAEFEKKELPRDAFLSWALASSRPRFHPGFAYLYSNIGYMLLGRVIERVSNTSYEHFAQLAVFRPLNISARIGEHKKAVDEVSYYSLDNANPYFNWDPTRLSAAAGWTLTASQVAALFQDVALNPVYASMRQPSRSKWDYGRGLQLGVDGSLYHAGSIAGVEALGFSRGDISVALIANLRGARENELTPWMLSLAREVARRL